MVSTLYQTFSFYHNKFNFEDRFVLDIWGDADGVNIIFMMSKK
jgi:hypothetical protein